MDRNRTVAGLDVHKDSIYLCIMGHDEAIIFEKTYGVLTPDLRQMCNDMVDRGVTEAAMESTAVYWVPVWNELCESMELKLVNPYFIKQLPGRKSDVKDARWIAECLLKNLIKGALCLNRLFRICVSSTVAYLIFRRRSPTIPINSMQPCIVVDFA